MSLKQTIIDRVRQESTVTEQKEVLEALSRYSGPESKRVLRDILILSRGERWRVLHNINRAIEDYRNILYWAEYNEDGTPKHLD